MMSDLIFLFLHDLFLLFIDDDDDVCRFRWASARFFFSSSVSQPRTGAGMRRLLSANKFP